MSDAPELAGYTVWIPEKGQVLVNTLSTLKDLMAHVPHEDLKRCKIYPLLPEMVIDSLTGDTVSGLSLIPRINPITGKVTEHFHGR